MPEFRFGIRLRLILGFAAVLALSMIAAAVCTGFAAHREVSHIQDEQDRVRAGRIHSALADYYDEAGDWDGLQDFVNRIGFQSEREIVVLDADGVVVADNRPLRRRHDDRGHRVLFNAGIPRGPLPPPQYFTPIMSDGSEVGAVAIAAGRRGGPVYIFPDSHSDEPHDEEPPLTQFTERVNRSLIVAGFVAGVVGIILVLLLSRRILGSIGGLTAAARRLGGGDLSSRVNVKGSDEIAELGHAFNNMADAVEDSERQRRSMVADVAHELRTPLSNIQGHIEAMQDGLLQPDAATLDTVHRQTLYLNRLVSDLSLLAQTEAQELRLQLEHESIVDIAARVVDSFRPRAEAQSVRLDTDLPDGLPLLNLDRLRIEQALGNLVDNAIRHTPPGGSVTIAVGPHGDGVRVVVTDTGSGIPSDALPHVFDRLYRVDPSRERATGGAGLGLTIARRLVEAHGGIVWAESEERVGSRFGFDLPAHEH
ncbi:MAG: HAMP domain-containing protein [Chloroflexi bacterium]|nr:HAMP domain-containing protein [Chloroflexota bacterium]MYD48750.1 HAMP domain-containing protein [Chloroflexota bacterium]